MERREKVEVPTPQQLTGNLALKNFTIPRKKRTSGKVVLEHCPEESRDYSIIQSKLRDSRLDTRRDQEKLWIWKDVRVVHNDRLLQKFSEKRAEMRAKGRHGRELEESFCFLVASDQATAHICQDNLMVGSSVQHALGKPSHGVYLFKHVDVALKSTNSTINATNLLIFKVLYGKVKKIAASVTWNKSQDPTIGFDCHMLKDVVSPRDSLHQQTLGSSVFLFDFDERQELNDIPRQCLPYAIVSFVPYNSVIWTPPLNVPFSPFPADPSHVNNFQARTVALRRGKGDNTTVVFQHFGPTQCSGAEHLCENTQTLHPKQSWTPISQNSPPPCSSQLHHQNLLRQNASLTQTIPDTQGRTDKCIMPKTSTIVYSSRSVRDPRLSRRETNGFGMTVTESGPKEPSEINTHKNKDNSLQLLPSKCVYVQKQKTETLPSIKLFKMKFQKYAEYFRLNEEERHKKVWSLENMLPEQKLALLDRIHFYEVYYQKYRKGLLSQEVSETEKASSVSLGELKEKHTQSEDNIYKHNQSDVCQSISYEATSSSETTCSVYRKKCFRGNDNTYNHGIKRQDSPEHCDVMLTEHRKDLLLPGSHQKYVDHINGCLVQSPGKHSKLSLELGSSNPYPVNENAYLQTVQVEQVPLSCPSNKGKINTNTECQGEPSITARDKSGPGVTLAERPSSELDLMYVNNITAMDIASCVEVSSCGLTENLSPPTTVTQEKNGQNVHMRNCFSQTKCNEDAEISSELNKSTHMEMYERLQLDQLLPSKTGRKIFSPRSYLTPIGRPTDTISMQVSKTKDGSKAEPHIMRGWKDLIVTIKSNQTPAHSTGSLTLSERFSQLKSYQRRLNVNRTDLSNCKPFQNTETQISSSKTGTCNVELIKLLAKRYNKAKLHAKYRSMRLSKNTRFLNKPSTEALGRFLDKKYVKKKHFWKAKRKVSRNVVPTEICCVATTDSPGVVFKSKNQEPEPNLRKMSHASDTDCVRQLPHIQLSQEANALEDLPQDHRCPVRSGINDLTPSLGLKNISETNEERIKPTEPLSHDSFYTNMKTTDDGTLNPKAIVNNVEQISTPENSSNQKKTPLILCDSNNNSNKDCESTITEEGRMLQEVTSETQSYPLGRAELNTVKDDNVRAFESLGLLNCDQVSATQSERKSPSFSHTTELLANMTPESEVMYNTNENVDTGSEKDALCDRAVDNKKTNGTNESMKCALNSQNMRTGEMVTTGQKIPNKKPTTSTNTSRNSSASSVHTEITGAKNQVLFKQGTSDSQPCGVQTLKCTSDAVVDLTNDNAALEHTKSNDQNLPVIISNTNQNCHLSRPEQNQNYDVDSPETQLISKLRDYLTKFESTVKKQEAVNEGLKEKPVVWITLDSTAHKQQLAEKGQYRRRKVHGNEHVQTGTDVYLLVPAESKRGKRCSETKKTDRYTSKQARWSSCTSVSPDSTSTLDTKDTKSPQSFAHFYKISAGPTENSLNDKPNAQAQLQSKETVKSQINPTICSQESVNMNGMCEHKTQANQSLDTVEIMDDRNVSSTFADSDYSVSDISIALKMADQTSSLTELESLQSKCKKMLQQFILSFERDQKVPLNQSFVSRHLIIEQYLDHPPAQVDLKYDAVNSYLELQMMMEVRQFVENKINFLRGKPTFRSLLWYDPSLYGELYKGEVGFQQQSSLFTSFQKILVQEGYAKLQEYYVAVSSLNQQLLVDPDASYYMYLKSKRELLEAEAALRNPHHVKSFFLSVPMAAMINFGDDLNSLEKVHKVIMRFVETPSDQLPGTFDVGKAEHLSITCRYLQEKAFFIRSSNKMVSKVSWFGIEHLLYDASKVLIRQDMNHGVSNEVLKLYKSSNPPIIFGVTESGVTLVNRVEQLSQVTDGAEKHKSLQSPMSSQPSDVQIINTDKKEAYTVAKRRASQTPITPCDMNDNIANPLFQTSPTAHGGNSTPYHTLHPKVHPKNNLVHWGKTGSTVSEWITSNVVQPLPSTSHVHSEIKSLLSKRLVTLSHSDQRTSLAAIQKPQVSKEKKRPLISVPQTNSQADSCVTHPSVKHLQTSTPSHCPVPSRQPVNQFTLAMTQPFSLPNFSLSSNFVAPPLSVQTLSNSLTHIPLPSVTTAINYPYFLLNGQTYTTDPTAAIHPDTRYYPNTI